MKRDDLRALAGQQSPPGVRPDLPDHGMAAMLAMEAMKERRN